MTFKDQQPFENLTSPPCTQEGTHSPCSQQFASNFRGSRDPWGAWLRIPGLGVFQGSGFQSPGPHWAPSNATDSVVLGEGHSHPLSKAPDGILMQLIPGNYMSKIPPNPRILDHSQFYQLDEVFFFGRDEKKKNRQWAETLKRILGLGTMGSFLHSFTGIS